MNMFSAILWLPMRITLLIWAWLWGWTYPLARPSIAEVRASAESNRFTVKNLVDSVRFALELPLMARAQQYAEHSTPTRTSTPEKQDKAGSVHSDRWLSEPAWRGRLRETLVWSTMASGLITWGSITVSIIFTGNFLFESHATPESPGYVSPYFQVAALVLSIQMTWIGAGLAVLGKTRRAA